MNQQTFLDIVVFGYIKKDLENMRDKIKPQSATIGNINFPLALCVLAYIEYLGGFLSGNDLGFCQNAKKYISECFANPDEYPVEILKDIFRNGLAHEYFARGGISRDGGRPAIYKKTITNDVILDAETLVNDFLESLDNFKQKLNANTYAQRLQQTKDSIIKNRSNNMTIINQLSDRIITRSAHSSGASLSPIPLSTRESLSSSSSQPETQPPSNTTTLPYDPNEK